MVTNMIILLYLYSGGVTINFVDLFCGCGGMSLGFIRAGYKLSGGFENWEYAINCYNTNLNNLGHKMDLSNVSLAVEEIKN